MLKEVVSWFKPEEKSRGVVEDVRIDGDRAQLDDTLRQVEATRALFGGEGEPERRVDVATVPFVLGARRLGPYEVRVTMQDDRTVAVSASTNDRTAPGTVPVCFLDEKGRLLFAPSVTLAEQAGPGGARSRSAARWPGGRCGRSSVPPATGRRAAADRRRAPPLGRADRRQHPRRQAGQHARIREEGAAQRPHAGLPGSGRNGRGRDGEADPGCRQHRRDAEFFLDLAAAFLAGRARWSPRAGSPTSLKVESKPVEKRFEIALGKIREGATRHSSRSASPPAK